MFMIFVVHCLVTITCGFELNHLKPPSNEAEIVNHRVKRGGQAIPFRPLFVYRQQQKEKQARWKLLEAQKQLKLQNLQNTVGGYSKNLLYPIKEDFAYRPVPVYPSYQATSPYQTNPTYQLYKNYEYYPVNSYEIYSTDPDRSSLAYAPSYANQQESYYDQFDSGYDS